jgi:hypothetical protein
MSCAEAVSAGVSDKATVIKSRINMGQSPETEMAQAMAGVLAQNDLC